MPGSVTASSVVLPVAVSTLLVDAAVEISAARFGGTLEPGVADGLLRKFNRIVDLWNANPAARYNVGFTTYTPIITGGHQPQTIGPTGADWLADPRPGRILAANVILNTSSPAVRVPIAIRTDEWWQNQSVQGMTASVVTDLYYSPDWPPATGNGSVYLWPVPNFAYPIELKTDTLFSAYKSTDTLWLPPGYSEALTLELAWKSAASLGQVASKELRDAARDARAICFEANTQTRNVRTRDGGLPGTSSGRRYLYRTGRMKGDS